MRSSLVGLKNSGARDAFHSRLPADKPVFGQYACAGPNGAVLRVGDDVKVIQRVSKSPTPLLPPSPGPSVRPMERTGSVELQT